MVSHREMGVRAVLVLALASCADTPLRNGVVRFLRGLSSDELQFIAEFLGSCILDAPVHCARSRAELAERIACFQRARADCARVRCTDQEHKMILLLEYLCNVAETTGRCRPRRGVPA